MIELQDLKTEQNLKDYADRNLRRDGDFYHCPVCGGSHEKATLHLDGNLFKCFYGTCDAAGSVIDLIKLVEGKDNKEAVRRARELYDPTFDPYWTPSQKTGQGTKPSKPNTATAKPKQEGEKTMTDNNEKGTIRRDFRNYFKHCRKRIYETDYPKRRGLDEEMIKKFGLGFDPNWTSPTAAYKRKQENEEIEKENRKLAKEGKPLLPLKPPLTPSPRLIIPIGRHNYLARDTRPDSELTDAQKDFKKANEGKDKPFFNIKAVENPLYFIVVEGELDCISILQAGGNCVALGTTQRAKAFGELLKQRDAMDTGTVVIALDNDTAGREATEKIVTACGIAGLDYITVNASGEYKDPNDYLVNDRKGFYSTIQDIVQQVRRERLAEYEEGNTAHAVKNFMHRPEDAGDAVPTGFEKLDAFLDGGLPAGLVFIGGLSALGKTTLALQIAENIARNKYPEGTQEVIRGRDVLYFALEQSQNDLLSKILSRWTYKRSIATGKNEKLAKTNIQLMRRRQWKDWTDDEWNNLWCCYKEYQNEVGENLRIIESPGDITALDIVDITERHIAITGRTPVVVVDYLQILKSIDPKMTDKQAVDRTIIALAKLAKTKETTVIGISAFNRENYWQRANMTAFKDTGNLEYSAEILFAIAPANMKEASGDKEKAANKEVAEICREAKDKDIQLHVLKNKSGKVTGRKIELNFVYHSWFNYFEEKKEKSYLSNFDNGNPAMMNGAKII